MSPWYNLAVCVAICCAGRHRKLKLSSSIQGAAALALESDWVSCRAKCEVAVSPSTAFGCWLLYGSYHRLFQRTIVHMQAFQRPRLTPRTSLGFEILPQAENILSSLDLGVTSLG